MRFARYWVPAILGFVLGSILSLRMSGTPMRDLLALAKWDAANEPRTAASNAMGSTSPLEENDRFARIFSALQEVRGLKKRSELHSAIGGLSAAELEALMNRIEALRGRLHSDDLNEVVLQRWFEIDRAGAGAWIRKHPNVRSHQVFWAKSDPEVALKELKQNPEMPWAEEIMRAAVEALAGGTLSEKARLVLELPDGTARKRVLTAITQEWSVREPAEAFTFAQKIADQDSRSALMTSTLHQWVRKDVEGALHEIAASLPEIENSRAFPNLLANAISALARKDITRAFEWIGSLPEQHRSAGVYSAAAQAWAGTQPIESLQWCMANGVDASIAYPQAGRGSVVSAAMQSNPVETLQWIQSQPAGATRDSLLERALVSRLAIGGLITSTQSDGLLQALQSLPEESRLRAALGVSRFIAGNSPQQLPGWLERFQDPSVRAATIAGAAELNAFRSTDATNDFASQFEEGPDRDAALRGMANAQSKYNTRAAADVALRIGDPALQWKTLDGFMVEWLRKEPTAAAKWLKNTNAIAPEWSARWQEEANSIY